MKPVKLVMSAFGSYAGQETIDFTDAAQGVFLVTGDTGAGKTTIFDAITYALFDQTSGGSQPGCSPGYPYLCGIYLPLLRKYLHCPQEPQLPEDEQAEK